MTEATSPPAAQGNLGKTPLTHLLLYLYQHRSSGTLLVGGAGESGVEPANAVKLLFQRGRVMAARFPAGAPSVEEGVLPLCAVADGPFEFYDEDLVGSGAGVLTGMFDPYAMVARAARTQLRTDVMQDVLGRFGGAQLRIQAGADVDRLRLTPEETKLVDVLRAEPASIATLCAQSELPIEATRALVYVLIITRIVAPYEPQAAPTFSTHIRTREPEGLARGTMSSAPPAPQPVSQRPVAAWQSLAARNVSRSLRPPPATATGTSSMSIKIVNGQTPRPSMAPPETLDVAAKIKRIELLCQRAAYDEAWPIARALVDEAPANAKHQGLLGYVALSRVTDNSVPKEVIDAVNAALRLNEDEVIALYTKALAYKRMGKDRESLHYFKRTVAVEPGHIDAAREIRLFGLRQVDDKKTRR